jgi:hypothetical protein
MDAKLTLNMDREIIGKAKKYAKSKGRSLSDPDTGVIITRNIKDYKAAELPVMTPETFLKTYLHTS